MNTSTIMEMLRADPGILQDIPGFVARMNEKTIKQIVSRHVEVIDEEIMVSQAERCGGEATERNVQDAVQIMNAQPLVDRVNSGFEQLKSAIMSGQCTDMNQVAALVNQLAANAVTEPAQ